MAQKIISILVVIGLLNNSLCFGMQHDGEEEHKSHEYVPPQVDMMDRISKAIEATDALVGRLRERGPKVTFLLGNTGSGKSTIYNSLEKIYLKGQYMPSRVAGNGKDVYVIDVVGKIGPFVARIGHEGSETSFPNVNRQGDLVDFSGFDDTRSLDQKAGNAYAMQRFLTGNIQSRLGLVFDGSMSLAEDSRVDFIEFIKRIQSIFPKESQPQNFKQSLNLIVTKAPEENLEKVRNQIKWLATCGRYPEQEEILNFVADQNRITLFRKQTDDKKVVLSDPLFNNDEYVAGLRPQISPDRNLKQAVQDYARGKVFENFREVFHVMAKDLDHIAREYICKKYTPLSLETIRQQFGEIGTRLEDRFGQFTSENRVRIQQELSLLTFEPSSWKALSQYSALAERLSALETIVPDIQLNMQDIGADKQICEKLKKWGTTPNLGGLNFQMEYSLLAMSELLEIIQSPPLGEAFSNVLIRAPLAFLIDENLERSGVNLSLETPLCCIKGDRKITLQGRAGKSEEQAHVPEKAEAARGVFESGADGKDGKKGGTGEYGGSFRAHVDVFANPRGLTINVEGGAGGNGPSGQQGGDGFSTKNIPGHDGACEDLDEKN